MKYQILYQDKPLAQRDDKWDMVKGIGIILMVLGHSGIPNSIHDFIYLFHMGLFFFVSGYFLKLPKNYENIKWQQDYYVFIKKKLKALWLPFVGYGLFFLALHNVFYDLLLVKDSYSFSEFLKELFSILIFKDVEPFVGPFWFLRSLFTGLVVTYIIIHMKKMENQLVVVLVLYSVGHYLSYKEVILPSQMQRELVIVSAIWSGYILSHSKFYFKIRPFYNFVLFLILAVSSIFVTIHSLTSEFSFPLAFPLFSFLGVMFCYNLAIELNSLMPNFGNILSFCGRYTIEILALHGLGFKISSFILVYLLEVAQERELVDNFVIVSLEKTPYCILNFICGMLLPIMFIWMKLSLKKSFVAKSR